MLKDGKYAFPAEEIDGFASRLRQVLESYGSTSSLARSIERSEGALRKWLRGESEPSVSDLRAICGLTGASVEWLILGRGDRTGSAASREVATSEGEGPLPPLNYSLMDDVILAVQLEPRIAGKAVTPQKCSSILTTVYNMSRVTRHVDREGAERIVALAG